MGVVLLFVEDVGFSTKAERGREMLVVLLGFSAKTRLERVRERFSKEKEIKSCYKHVRQRVLYLIFFLINSLFRLFC